MSNHSLQKGAETVRVLHVDDEPSFGDLVATYLERTDDCLEVTTETSPRDALNRLEGNPPDIDCIVSDYDMPEMDGLEFLNAVRTQYPSLPFILFTGKGSETLASDAISAGVTDYLQKGHGTDVYTLLANRIKNATIHRGMQRRFDRQTQLMRKIFDVLPVGVLAEDVNRTVIAVNEHYVDIFDYDGSPSELLGTNAGELAKQVSERIVKPENFVDRTLELLEEDEPVQKETIVLDNGRTLARTHVPFEYSDGIGYLWVYDEIAESDPRE